MINRYQGNSGKVRRYNEAEMHRAEPESFRAVGASPRPRGPVGALDGLNRLLPEKLGELDIEDIILLLILYLMYRESGDSDLLIIMGAMFLL